MNQTPCPYDLIIGLDRSDKKADLCLITTATGQRQNLILNTSPEALWEWLAQWRQDHPRARVALCVEQPAGHLISFREAYEWIAVLPLSQLAYE